MTKAEWKARALDSEERLCQRIYYWCRRNHELRADLWLLRDKLKQLEDKAIIHLPYWVGVLVVVGLGIVIYAAGVLTGLNV